MQFLLHFGNMGIENIDIVFVYCLEDEMEELLLRLSLIFVHGPCRNRGGAKKNPENAMVFDNFSFVYIGPTRNIAKHDFTDPPCDTQNIDVLHTVSLET